MWTHFVWDTQRISRTRVTMLIRCTCQTHLHHPYVNQFLLWYHPTLHRDVLRDLVGLWRDMAMDCDTTRPERGDVWWLWTLDSLFLIIISVSSSYVRLCNHLSLYIYIAHMLFSVCTWSPFVIGLFKTRAHLVTIPQMGWKGGQMRKQFPSSPINLHTISCKWIPVIPICFHVLPPILGSV